MSPVQRSPILSARRGRWRSGFRLGHWQVGDIERIIVIPPFALAADVVGDFSQGQVRPKIGIAPERGTEDQQRTALADILELRRLHVDLDTADLPPLNESDRQS